MKRTLGVLAAIFLLSTTVAGCLPVREEVTQVEGSEAAATGSGSSDSSAEGSDAAAGPAELSPETDGEKEALTLADSEEARKWGSGDWQNGTPVAGEPSLVGYGVFVHDGVTQYQVTVVGGEVVGFFSNTNAQRYIESPFADYNPAIAPASARQTEAFEAAKAEIASVNPNATQGGIEYYMFFYPSQDEGTYPYVAVYTAPVMSESPWAMGGSFGWQ